MEWAGSGDLWLGTTTPGVGPRHRDPSEGSMPRVAVIVLDSHRRTELADRPDLDRAAEAVVR